MVFSEVGMESYSVTFQFVGYMTICSHLVTVI